MSLVSVESTSAQHRNVEDVNVHYVQISMEVSHYKSSSPVTNQVGFQSRHSQPVIFFFSLKCCVKHLNHFGFKKDKVW